MSSGGSRVGYDEDNEMPRAVDLVGMERGCTMRNM